MFHGWDDQASFHFGLPSRSRLFTCGGLRVPRAVGREPQCTSASHVCVFCHLLLFHWPEQVTCSNPESVQEGTTYRCAVRETCTNWGHSSNCLSQGCICLPVCVCVCACAVVTIIDDIKFSP